MGSVSSRERRVFLQGFVSAGPGAESVLNVRMDGRLKDERVSNGVVLRVPGDCKKCRPTPDSVSDWGRLL